MLLSRRTILGAVGASTALAGCLADDEPDEMEDDSDEMDEMEDESDEMDDSDEAVDDPADGTVRIRSHTEFGDILVDSDDMTLYNFDQDEQGDLESACYDDCAEAWPPLTVEGEPSAGDGVTAELTTFEREDGSTQVVANGWPLYYFASDEEPGDAEGQGVNDVWWVLGPDGTPLRADDADGDDAEADEDDADATVAVGADEGLEFDPDELEVDAGDTVAFVWEADGHNIAVIDQPAEAEWAGVSELQDAGYTHEHTFEVAGEYEYVCEPHEEAGMTGEVVVSDPDEEDDDDGIGY